MASATLHSLLTTDRLKQLGDASSYSRGLAYAVEGRVSGLYQTGDRLEATVRGKRPYSVALWMEGTQLVHRCDCPMGDLANFCKHAVAVGHLAAKGHAKEQAAAIAQTEADQGGPFATSEGLKEWLRKHGLAHLARAPAGVLGSQLSPTRDGPLLLALSRHRLLDVACEERLNQVGYGVSHLPQKSQVPAMAWRFLEEQRQLTEQARASVPSRLRPPPDERVRPLFDALVTLRSDFPESIAPVTDEALALESFAFVPGLPGFTLKAKDRYEATGAFGFVWPVATLSLSPGGAKVSCTCRDLRCTHALAAVDSALAWLKQPSSPERELALEELCRPQWERALRALGAVLDDAEAAPSQGELEFRLRVYPTIGVEVAAYLRRSNKRGKLSAGTRLPPRSLLSEHSHLLSESDRRIAQKLGELLGRSNASRELLLELVGHPRVVLEDEPERAVRVERGVVGLVAEERNGAVVLGLGLDGTLLPAALLERSRLGLEQAQFLWEGSSGVLTVLDFPKKARALIDALEKHGNEFPPESRPALLEKLSLASARIPVALPRSVMGRSVVPTNAPVVRLELQPGGRVRVDLRVRTLPESMAFIPGQGPKDVHVRRETEALHAVRNFPAEELSATALATTLALSSGVASEEVEPDRHEPFSYELPHLHAALDLLSRCKAIEPGSPELEWRGESLHVAGTARLKALKVTLERKRDWFGVLGELSVEGERVELAVLLDAARRRQRYVEARPHTFVELEESLRRELEKLADHTYRSSVHGLEIGPSGVDAVSDLEEAGAKVQADKTWRELAERIFLAKELKPRVPASLKATLRDYQEEGFRWLMRLASWGAGGVLADDMGLGKTVQSLAVLLSRAKLGPALVLAPTSVGFNWVDELKRFAPSLKPIVYADVDDRGKTLERLKAGDVLILSYGLLSRDIERLAQRHFATLIFDEAQALKNAVTDRAKAARLLQGDFRFALSGTPLENHLGELWSLFRIVFPGLLGSWEAFRSRFATPIEKKIDPTAAPALARVLQPFLLRRTKSQVARELPARTEMQIPVVLSAEEWQLYEDARLAALSELETPTPKLREQQRRIEVLAALTRLRLLASHPKLYDAGSTLESSKLRRLLELVDDLHEEGHRALVFSQFTSHLALVREALEARGLAYEYLDGSTPRVERKKRVTAFQEGSAPLFLISLKAGGFGLNLTGADYVIHLDPWWNPAVEDQASDRAHRIGQTKPVTVLRLVAKGTIEEQILALHEDKRALVAGVLEGKEEAGRLTTNELLGLLAEPATRDWTKKAPKTKH